MSKIKNGGLDQYGAEPFEQQQFRTPGVERINIQIFILTFTQTHSIPMVYNMILNSLGLDNQCDRRTDRHTDGQNYDDNSVRLP